MNPPSHYRKVIAAAAAVCIFAVLSAGCISETSTIPENYPVVDDSMNALLDAYVVSLDGYASLHDGQLLSAADKLTVHDSASAEARGVLRYLYADMKDAVAVVFYDENFNSIIQVPWTTTQFKPVLIEVTEENKNSIVTHGPYDNEWFGSVFAVSAPVYSTDGSYKGRVAAFFRSNVLITAGSEGVPGIAGYALFVTGTDGTILASSHSYNIGTSAYDKEIVDSFKTSKDSGVIYMPVFNSLSREAVPMSAVWQKVRVHNTDLIVGLGKCGDAANLSAYIDPSITENELTAYVAEMQAYALAHTKEETLAYIHNLSGLTPASVYPAFAIEYDGNVLEMAGYPGYNGLNVNRLEDSYGIQQFKGMKLRALEGGGYIDFYMDTALAAVTDEAVLNLAYVLPVGSQYYVGAVIPTGSAVSGVDQSIITELDATMSAILRYFYDNKRDMLIKAVADGKFSSGTTVVTGISYTGEVLCQSPQFVPPGTNLFEALDSHGNTIVKDLSLAAKRGGGYLYYCYPGANNQNTLYVCSIQPLEGDWFIVVGTPAETGPGI